MAAQTPEIREADNKGRITLPGGFANCTVLIEVVSDVELVIRKAKVLPSFSSAEQGFSEEGPITLSGEDRDAFLAALDCPPPPTEALKRLMAVGYKSQ